MSTFLRYKQILVFISVFHDEVLISQFDTFNPEGIASPIPISITDEVPGNALFIGGINLIEISMSVHVSSKRVQKNMKNDPLGCFV